MQYNLITSTGT